MNKYEVRTNKKKGAIIHAALKLFQEKGYTNTSINEIASDAGVSPVSIYNYFGSKEGLVKESVSLLLRETNEIVATLLAGNGTFADKLSQAVSTCTEKPHELLDKYFTKEALDDKTFIDLFNENVNKVRMDVFVSFIECGKQEGAINPHISTDTILQFLAAASSIQAGWETKDAHKEKSKELYQLILYGLIGQ